MFSQIYNLYSIMYTRIVLMYTVHICVLKEAGMAWRQGAFLPLAWRKSSVLEGALPATALRRHSIPGMAVSCDSIFF